MTFHSKHRIHQLLLTILLACILILPQPDLTNAATGDSLPFIVLSSYRQSIPIDGQFLLIAITSDGSMPTFKSSSSAIASVNTYGIVTGKKSGDCTITAKIKRAEASCRVTVEKSVVTISESRITLENGESATLSATVSTGHEVRWRSSSSAIVGVDEEGIVTAKKCGSAIIRATADGVSAKCRITVKKPSLSLNRSSITLYPEESFILTARCSSNRPLTFRSSASAVASVDESGRIIARKKGTATITVKVDGVSRICKVTVKQPKSNSV
ncbi:MAG: Ig-like domain-containing protein [Lachnospiraceae bacterium]|nr:Ig-like domain-containing protein [Lachnospiraceae bacterium]